MCLRLQVKLLIVHSAPARSAAKWTVQLRPSANATDQMSGVIGRTVYDKL